MTENTTNLKELSRDIESSRGSDRECELRLRRATILRKADRNDEAVADYLEVVELTGGKQLKTHAKAMLSLIAIEAREYKDALWWGSSAYDSDPNNLDANTAIGLALVASDFHRMAIPFFRFVHQADPTSTTARLYLGICLRETLDFVGAHEVLSELSEECCDPRAFFELGWTWHLRYDVPESKVHARSSYLRALELKPSNELRERIEREMESLE